MRSLAGQSGRPSRAVFDIALYGLSQVLQGGIALALMAVIARALGPDGFGEFSFLFVLGTLFGLVADFGLGPWLSRAVAQNPDLRSRAFHLVLSIRLRLLGIWFLMVAGVAAIYLRDLDRALDFFMLALYPLLIGYIVLFESFLMGLRRVGRVSFATVLGRFFELAAVLLGLWFGYSGSVFGIGSAICAGAALRLGLLWLLMRSLLSRGSAAGTLPDGVHLELRGVVREVLPFAAAAVFWTAYSKLDVLILETVVTPLALGLYTAAYRLIEALLMIPRTIVGVLAPVLSRAWAESRLGPPLLASPSRWILVIATGAAGGLVALSEEIMVLLFGARFGPGAGALRILGLSLIPMFLNQFLGVVYTASHQQRLWSMFLAGGLVLNVLANLVLIPRLGYMAAAWVRFGTEAAFLVAMAAGLLRGKGFAFPWGWAVRLLLAVLGMYFAVAALAMPLFVRISIGAAVYLALVTILRVIDSSEWGGVLRSLRSGLAGTTQRS